MATSLAGAGNSAAFGWNYQNVLGLGNSLNASSFKYAPTQYANGTGAGQCDRLYAAQLTLAASGTFSITLTNFTDFFGNTLSMLRFKSLFVNLVSGGASSIAVGNATNPLANWISVTTATIQVRSGGLLWLDSPVDATGYPIVAGASDTLKITNNDSVNVATVNLGVYGCSA